MTNGISVEVSKALDEGAAFWEIPEHERVEPEIWNHAQCIRDALRDHIGADDQDTGLTALYTRLHIDKQLKHPYKLRAHQIRIIAHQIRIIMKREITSDHYGCETCQLGGCDSTHALIARPYMLRACYLPENAPFMAQLNRELIPLLECHTCQKRVTFRYRGDETYYCTDHECLLQMLKRADAVWQEETKRRAEKRRLQDALVQERIADDLQAI